MTFYVGQKVVCVDAAPAEYVAASLHIAFPVKGAVYTVRDINADEGKTWLRLVEIVNPVERFPDGNYESDIWAGHFRPAVSPTTDISIFEEILDRTVKGEPVDA